MNVLSIPIIMMAGILFFGGFYYLFIYYRRRLKYREDLYFALTSLAMGMFNIFSFRMYNAASVVEGIVWQRNQASTIFLIGAAFVWFATDYLKLNLNRFRNIFSVFFIISAIFIFIDRSSLTLTISRPDIKEVIFPFFNLEMTYYEVTLGPFINFAFLLGSLFFLFILFAVARKYWQHGGFKARSLCIALLIFSVGTGNDIAVLNGLYEFIYVIEYTFMGIVIVMAHSLSNTLVESDLIKEELQNERNLLLTLITALPDRIYVKDTECRFLIVNKSVSNKLGAEKPEDIVGKTDFDFYPRELAEHYHADDLLVLQSNQTLIDREEPTVDAEGNSKWTSTSKTPMRNNQDEIIGLVGIGHDITERKRIEMKLDDIMKKLHQSNQELEQFAYVASHDLQEPLRTVSSYIDLISKRYKNKLDKEAEEFINFALDGTNRMKILIQDLLNYSRITTEANPFESIDSEDILIMALDNLNVTIKETGTEITHSPLPTILADQSQLIRLFQNLIGNAIKYNQNQPKIHVSAKKKDNQWVFAFKDNGIGIDPKFQDRIFGVFQRLHGRDEYSGTGIGLAVCKKIVERHGGKIWVDSKQNVGSTFYFTLSGA